MAWWVYKCNSKNQKHQVCYGDWDDLFSQKQMMDWGNLDLLPDLKQLKAGDRIIAFQSNRNAFVGVATVVKIGRDRLAYLKPDSSLARFDVKVLKLKRANPEVADIHAFKTRAVQTLYPISGTDARILLKAAQKALRQASTNRR